MCLLTYYPQGTAPQTDALLNGAQINNDGHGFAIVADNRIVVRRSMDPEQLVESFERMRKKNLDGPALFHSRLSTHGSIEVQNCHPFFVGGDRRTVVAHNGILPKEVHPQRGDSRSDTRVAAEDFLPNSPFGSFATRAGRRRLTQWLGRGNKLAILTVDPRYRSNSYLLNEECGIWDDGVWYSNLSYLDPFDEFSDGCPLCESAAEMIDIYGFCEICGCCVDCEEYVESCGCYVPAAQARV
ncbi:class II glutamine amidotransferase [Saccharopolyspora shandongensis]|uniref:class II glutamine amidotransferase n=1 Tax=Saccharopolyspora shandongensis TaxID=418495 RepID=UPI0034419B5E